MNDLSLEINKNDILVPVIPKLLENINYMPQAMGIFYNYSEEGVLSRKEFHKALSYCCGWSKYKINKAIDALEFLGLILDYNEFEDYLSEHGYSDNEKVYVHGFFVQRMLCDNPRWEYDGQRITNLKIDSNYFFKMVSELDDISFKMMIFLMMNDDFQRNFLHRIYTFSVRGKSGIMEGLGYVSSNATAAKLTEKLEALKEQGFIDYSISRHQTCRFGRMKGQYMTLEKIYRYNENGYVEVKIPISRYEEVMSLLDGESK